MHFPKCLSVLLLGLFIMLGNYKSAAAAELPWSEATVVGITSVTTQMIEPGINVRVKCLLPKRAGIITTTRLLANLKRAEEGLSLTRSSFNPADMTAEAQRADNPFGYRFTVLGATDQVQLAEFLADGNPCRRPADSMLSADIRPTPVKTGTAVVQAIGPTVTTVDG